MSFIIDDLPGSQDIAERQGIKDTILENYKNFRILFSYAHEDWPFVEKVAQALRIYFPQKEAFEVQEVQIDGEPKTKTETMYIQNVFCYTDKGEQFKWTTDRNPLCAAERYKKLIEQANVFIVFNYKGMIKAGPPNTPGAGNWQKNEVFEVETTNKETHKDYAIDLGKAHDSLPRETPNWTAMNFKKEPYNTIHIEAYDMHWANQVAERILRHLLFDEPTSDVPPRDTIFSYEKSIVQMYQEIPDIIKNYLSNPAGKKSKSAILKLFGFIRQGVPPFWPCIPLLSDIGNYLNDNQLVSNKTIGSPRNGIEMLWPTDARDYSVEMKVPDMVVAAALSRYHKRYDCHSCMLDSGFSFPEAGPRKRIYIGKPDRVAIAVSGGIAPGINAVVDGIVSRHKSYKENTTIYGIHHGFFGLIEPFLDFIEIDESQTAMLATQGGSFLKTCRMTHLLPQSRNRNEKIQSIVDRLNSKKIEVLYLIGGDGTMRAARLLADSCRKHNISVVGIPKTMDNDILWVWQSFGFATAVEKARESIEYLGTEVSANPRICVLQLFGSASGFVVSHAVLASTAGTCDFALIPEVEFDIDALAWKLALKIVKENRTVPFGLIVMAESALPSKASCQQYRDKVNLSDSEKDALDSYLQYRDSLNSRFPDGQISTELRSAALKLVSEGLKNRVKDIFCDTRLKNELCNNASVNSQIVSDYYTNDEERFRVFTNEPRHLLRSVPPSFSDVIMGNRLGALAVDNAMAGYTGFMISQWLTEFVMVPLDLVALGRKHIPQDGIFWKSVLAKTGQGDLSTPPSCFQNDTSG